MNDSKYVVIKRAEWEWLARAGGDIVTDQVHPLDDCVVLRKRDRLTRCALDVYADCAALAAEVTVSPMEKLNLQRVADYFQAQAEDCVNFTTKLPD